MREETEKKVQRLRDDIAAMGDIAVGYSAGVDSTYLLAVAHDVLGDKAVGVTCTNAFVPRKDLEDAVEFCNVRGIRHMIVEVDPLRDDIIRQNPKDRCYHCKKKDFTAIIEAAKEIGINHIAVGSNADDMSDYRPGNKAMEELGVVSPLLDAGLTKDEIREASREMGLPTWDKPSAACLASRVPYGEELTEGKLSMIDRAEEYLAGLGFGQLRVRTHGDLARIEVPASEIERFADEKMRSDICEALKGIGYTYVTLDLAGYRMGSLNEVL